ncbi:hypothetical protein ACP4OV_015985 [Aristida adscensionis]
MAADWSWARRAWEKWAAKHVGASGLAPTLPSPRCASPVPAPQPSNGRPCSRREAGQGGAAAQLRPHRALPPPPRHRAEQEGAQLNAVDMQPFLDFVKRDSLQMEFFSIGPNQYLVTSIHEHWFCARCVNTTKPGGEGVIVMQIGAYLLVSMYDGSLGSASQAMVAADQFAWHFNRRAH